MELIYDLDVVLDQELVQDPDQDLNVDLAKDQKVDLAENQHLIQVQLLDQEPRMLIEESWNLLLDGSMWLDARSGGWGLSSTGKSFGFVRACARFVCLVSSG